MYVIVVYDIKQERVSKVCKYLRQRLLWIQNSVFEGEISAGKLENTRLGLKAIINESEDSVIIYQLGSDKWLAREVIGIEKNSTSNLL